MGTAKTVANMIAPITSSLVCWDVPVWVEFGVGSVGGVSGVGFVGVGIGDEMGMIGCGVSNGARLGYLSIAIIM